MLSKIKLWQKPLKQPEGEGMTLGVIMKKETSCLMKC